MGGIADWIDQFVGGKASKIGPELVDLSKTAKNLYNTGGSLTDEGLNDLRGYRSTYADRLANPLGTGPNSASGIFSRARGALSDIATQRTGAFGARLQQQAAQSGGVLSPEARAELEAQNQRGVNQDLFEGNVGISNAEATATLSETSKLFDRMENISKTILGVGSTRETQGLQAMLAALQLRFNRNAKIADTIAGSFKPFGGIGGTNSSTNAITGST